MLRVPINQVAPTVSRADRMGEPVRIGIPLPEGTVSAGATVRSVSKSGQVRPAQMAVLDSWESGSVRWACCDLRVDVFGGVADIESLEFGADETFHDGPNRVRSEAAAVEVDTGSASFRFEKGQPFPCSSVKASGRALGGAVLNVESGGRAVSATIVSVRVASTGPCRTEIELVGAVMLDRPLEISARVELFNGTATVRCSVIFLNPQQAAHEGGKWGLGDPGSISIDRAAIIVPFASPVTSIGYTNDIGGELSAGELPFSIIQASSGGANWQSRVHVDRDGKVDLPFQGYEMRSGRTVKGGLRSTPVVVVTSADRVCGIAVPNFWEEFPRSISVTTAGIEVGLFPAAPARPAELQGGERKTHRLLLAFAADGVSSSPLGWCHDPVEIAPPADWVADTKAVPYLTPAGSDVDRRYGALVNEALDSSHGFVAKREQQDEYGWRHFGDLPADHESAFRPADDPFISHYNNQYDPIAGCLMQFWRTGDPRWRRLGSELARHVRDIDIYHTDRDKSAYNHGLFWHTAHYLDAGTSTHRTYPPTGPGSGGPSAEHNYNAGLMWHYFLTGEEASRDAALELGRWVIDMDDGRRTVFRFLAKGPTGLAGKTADYYGPGRGAGHSILALLAAFRLSQEREYLAKADELIRRTAHPSDGIASRHLENAELRWSYTSFLQALGAYLDLKMARGERDAMFDYARATLLHYARWVAQHEEPYLDHPDRLEFPTETWAAQDMRKAEVLLSAAIYASSVDERNRFLERGRFFFDYSVRTLASMPTHVFTRPTVLLLSFGFRFSWLEHPSTVLPDILPSPERDFGRPVVFTPQKAVALRRAALLAAAGTALTFGTAAWLLFW